MAWEPEFASKEIEERMERADVAETDRDEVRRLAEFLQRRKDKRAGIEAGPLPAGMKEWLSGDDVPRSNGL